MNVEQEQAMKDLNLASKKVAQSLGMKQGGSGAEKAYSQAYQAAVRTGAVQQIKKKYR